MVVKLAARNLFRNRWRSALTVGGIAVAAALLTWSTALMDGIVATMVKAFTSVELGQVQIHTEAYAERPSIYDTFPESPEMFEEIRSVPEVDGAAGRCHVFGLIGHERRSQVAQIMGISPESEPDVTLLDQTIVSGRWLSAEPPAYPAPREVLLGRTFADQLGIEVGAELVVFLQAADGSLGNDLLQVVGIFSSGNSMIDRATAVMNLADVQFMAALDGRLHEIAVKIRRILDAPQVAAAISAALANGPPTAEADGSNLLVQPWQEIVPELATMIELYDRSTWIMFLTMMVIVALGILNTQRMSALERRREFGVLMAIGLTPKQLGRMIEVETVLLSLLGAVIGTALGLGISLYQAKYGMDMSAFTSQTSASFSMMGVSFVDRIYTVVTAKAALLPLVWTGGVALLCGLWPAFTSARLHVPQAISGRTD